MRSRLRFWWPVLKGVLFLAIMFLVGRQFVGDLQRPELWQRHLEPAWLLLAGVLYLVGFGFSALFWHRLLRRLHTHPPFPRVLRAYFLGQFGKYLPGKAWALAMRAGLVRDAGVGLGLGALTSFYEVLTTMATGALVSAVLSAVLVPVGGSGVDWQALEDLFQGRMPAGTLDRGSAVVLALVLVAVLGTPILPPIFDRVRGLLLPAGDAVSVTPIGMAGLGEGVLLTAVGWLCLGVSLCAVLAAVLGPDFRWSVPLVGRLTAVLGLGYVASFLVLVAPSGLGVREFLLTLLLTPELETALGVDPDDARPVAVLAVLVLRLTWTVAEVLMAALVWRLPAAPAPGETP